VRPNGTPAYVLDSFALLSYLQNEAGANRVEDVLRESQAGRAEVWLSIINYGEALYVTERARGLTAAHQAIAAIDSLPVQVVDASRTLTFSAAHVKATLSLAYADAFAVALALETGGRVITGDPEFKEAESLILIEWIPR
jgi:ribonuclease VapC